LIIHERHISVYDDASWVWVRRWLWLKGSSYVLSELLIQAVLLIIWFGENETRQPNWCLYGKLRNCNGVSHVAVLIAICDTGFIELSSPRKIKAEFSSGGLY